MDGKNYDNDQHRVYDVQVPLGKRIVLELFYYDIEYQNNCVYDYLKIEGVLNGKRFCGTSSNKTTLISYSNRASIMFVTDSDVTRCGYYVTWYTVNQFESVELDVKSKRVQSVNYPRAFPDKVDNCTIIHAADDQRMIVELTELNLPGSDCSKSRLVFFSTSTFYNRTFCGGSQFGDLDYFEKFYISEDSKIVVCFSSDSLEAHEGFVASIEYGKYWWNLLRS